MKVLLLTGMYPSDDSPWNGIAVKAQVESLEALGVKVDTYLLRSFGPFSYLSHVQRLKTLLATGEYDIVHMHYGIKATILARSASVPVVATYHGTDVNGYSWGRVGRIVQWVLYNLAAWGDRTLSKRFAAVIVMTAAMKRKLPGSTQRKTHVIPMGTDAGMFVPVDRQQARTELGWGSEPVVVFASSNNDPIKRQDLAEAAMAHVSEQVPGARLFLLKGVEHAKVPAVLSAADCLLISSDKEGAPNIAREAIMCGLPIVSVDVGDVPELVARYEGIGTIVSRKPEEIAAGIVATIQQERPPVNARARDELSLESAAEKVFNVYRDVLGRSGTDHE